MAFARQADQRIRPAVDVEQCEWPRCPVCNARISPAFAADFGGCQRHVQRLPAWLPSWRGFSKA